MNTFDIIIPIFNAYGETRACLESVVRHTSPQNSVLLVDDASSDPRITGLLAEYAGRNANIRCFRMPQNSGFVAATNWGMSHSSSDVVLLNSDTIVTAGWLGRLSDCLNSNPKAGIASPLSNNAFILSFPRNNFRNELPLKVSPDDYAAVLAGASLREYPEIPSAVGFCMAIRRAVIQTIGLFDSIFLDGYGEEVDFSYRAKAAGFTIVCADDTFVYHKGSASFTDPVRAKYLRHRAERILNGFWASYPEELIQFQLRDPFAPLASRVESALQKTVGPQH